MKRLRVSVILSIIAFSIWGWKNCYSLELRFASLTAPSLSADKISGQDRTYPIQTSLKEPGQLFYIQGGTEDSEFENKNSSAELPPVTIAYSSQSQPEAGFHPLKVVDNFDISSDAISTWWDGDGTKIYKRELVQDIKRSGDKSMKVYFKKTDPNLSWSFFAFQPQQDGKNNDFSKYSKLVFWLYVPETLEEGVPLELMVKLEDKNGKGYEQRFKFQAGNDWQLVEFDISKVQGIDLSSINNVLFFADPGKYMTAGEFWLDDIYLIKKGYTVPEEIPAPPANPVVKEKFGLAKLIWSDTPDSKAVLYEVQISTSPDFSTATSFWTDKTELLLQELEEKTYYFKVRSWTHLPEFGGKCSEFNQIYKWAK